jgi:hypothetical protein
MRNSQSPEFALLLVTVFKCTKTLQAICPRFWLWPRAHRMRPYLYSKTSTLLLKRLRAGRHWDEDYPVVVLLLFDIRWHYQAVKVAVGHREDIQLGLRCGVHPGESISCTGIARIRLTGSLSDRFSGIRPDLERRLLSRLKPTKGLGTWPTATGPKVAIDRLDRFAFYTYFSDTP